MKKFRQIAAIVLIAFLIILYLSTLITGIFATEASNKLFMFSIVMTFFVPVVMYILNMFAKLFKNSDATVTDETDENDTKDSNDNN